MSLGNDVVVFFKTINLLDYLQEIDGLEKNLRFATSFPKDITKKMIDSMKNNS